MGAFVQRSQSSRQREPLADISNSSSMHSATRPRKRVKVKDSRDSSNEESSAKSFRASQGTKHRVTDNELGSEVEDDSEGQPLHNTHHTEFEDAMPPVATDKEAIEEYEAMRASQQSAGEQDENAQATTSLDKRKCFRGKSSIYVDAFNLALETVLEDEAHLFDKKELHVFEGWRGLNYEAQYL